MSASERKSELSAVELKPFYTIPDEIAIPIKVEIDANSKRLIEKGSSQELNLFGDEVKAGLGQRYVMVAFVKNGIAHLRAIPGFEYIEDEKERETLTKKAVDFFECKVAEVAFPNHAIWTGVVHEQLIKQISLSEPDVVEGSLIIPFSMIKNNGKYLWLNRSARNENVFHPDALASACYVFEQKASYENYQPPAFDLFYHLKRAIPKEFFIKLTEGATEAICDDDLIPLSHLVLDECPNFGYEAKWDALCKKYNRNNGEAVEEIQHMLMRNLHVYLSGLSAPDFKERAQEILLCGFKEAEKLDIPIDVNFIPREFKGDEDAITKAEKFGFLPVKYFLEKYSFDYYVKQLLEAVNDADAVNKLLVKINAKQKPLVVNEFILLSLLSDKTNEVANLYNFCRSESDKLMICQILIDVFKGRLQEGRFTPETFKILPREILLPYIKNEYSDDVTFPTAVLYHFAETLFEEKPNFNKKYEGGQTLLHMAASLPQADLVSAILVWNADPDVLNNEGQSPLICASVCGQEGCMKRLISGGANVDFKGSGEKSPLEYAMENEQYNIVNLMLERNVQFPIRFASVVSLEGLVKYNVALLEFPSLQQLVKTVEEQKNIEMESAIFDALYDSFFVACSKGRGVSSLLQLTSTRPLAHIIKFDTIALINRFLLFLEKVPMSERDGFIDKMLDEKSVIGVRLLQDKKHGVQFRQDLNNLKLNVEHMCSVLRESLMNAEFDKAKQLMKAFPGIMPHLEDHLENNTVALHLAHILMEEKPDFNEKLNGFTLFHMAVVCSDTRELVIRLFQNNADPNILDVVKRGALECALECRQYENAILLIMNGARFSEDYINSDKFHPARYIEIIRVLIKKESMPDDIKLELIQFILKPESVLGKKLLKQPASSALFSMSCQFREDLLKIQADIESGQKLAKRI